MYTDIWNRGGKKFGHLFLVHPHVTVTRYHGDTHLAVEGMVDDEVLLVGDTIIHGQSSI